MESKNMADTQDFKQVVNDAILDADSLEQFINGSDSETVLTRLSAEYPTLQKALKELFENGGIAGRFKTLSDLQASDLSDGSYALVADDTDDKNGIYIKEGPKWVRSKYSPIFVANKYTDQATLSLRHEVVGMFAGVLDNPITVLSDNEIVETDGLSLLRVKASSLSATTDVLRTLRIEDDGVAIASLQVLPQESVNNGFLTTVYDKIKISDMGVHSTSVSGDFLRVNLTSNGRISGSSRGIADFNVFDITGKITPRKSAAASLSGAITVSTHQSAPDFEFMMFIPLTLLPGYSQDKQGAEQYISNNLNDVVFKYVTTETKTTPIASDFILKDTIYNITSTAWTGLSATVFSSKSESKEHPAYYSELICDVLNDSVYDYTSYPVELKVDFDSPFVSKKEHLKIVDEDGNEYKAQFAGAKSNNLRDRADIGYYPCGAYKTGSIWFIADIPAKSKKVFKLITGKTVEHTNISKVNGEETGVSVVAFGNKYFFDNGTGNTLYKANIDGVDVAVTDKIRVFESANDTTSEVLSTVKLVEVREFGDVFTEIHVVSELQQGVNLISNALEHTHIYRIFSSGHIQIRTQTSANVDIPPATLFSKYQDIYIPSPNYTNLDGKVAGLLTENLPNAWSVVPTVVNGDIHREGRAAGPLRSILLRVFNSTTSFRLLSGWSSVTLTDSSFLEHGVDKDWTWSNETWLNIDEKRTDLETIEKATQNRLAGFLFDSYAPNVLETKAVKGAYDAGVAFAKWWVSDKAQSFGGGSAVVNTTDYPIAYELGEFLDKGRGDFDAIYSKFKGIVSNAYGSFDGLGDKYLTGGYSSANVYIVVTTPMELFYKAAVKLGKTTIADELAAGIKSIADGFASKALDNNGQVPILGNQSASAVARNLQCIALYHIALGINIGADPDETLQDAFDLVEATLKTNAASYYYPTAFDDTQGTSSAAMRHYLLYESITANMYSSACRLVGKQPIFNLNNKFLLAINGDGRYDEINWCRSESRRGSVVLASSNMVSLLNTPSLSYTAAAYKSATLVGNTDWVEDMTKTHRMYGFRYMSGNVEVVTPSQFSSYAVFAVTEHIRRLVS